MCRDLHIRNQPSLFAPALSLNLSVRSLPLRIFFLFTTTLRSKFVCRSVAEVLILEKSSRKAGGSEEASQGSSGLSSLVDIRYMNHELVLKNNLRRQC